MISVKLDMGRVTTTEIMTWESLRESPFFAHVDSEIFDDIVKRVEAGEVIRYLDYVIKKI